MNDNEEIKEERLHRRFFKEYKEKRQKILTGGINCIPFPFERFRKELPGIEKAKNYIITANSKVGKTQIADFLFVLSVINYAFKNRDKVRVKILYFSLEMSIQEKMSQFTCYWLYTFSNGKIRIDTKQLNSLNENNPLSEEVLEILDSREYKEFFDFLEDVIIFDETNRNPYGIFKKCVEFAEANGKITYKTVEFTEKKKGFNKITGEEDTIIVEKTKKVKDRYIPNDPELYVIKIVDHVSLYSTESKMDLRQTIGKASSQDNVVLRNIYGFTCVDVQQQAADKEGNESFKLGRITPSPDGLGENKTTQRDCNVMLGLFSPYKFAKSVNNSNITQWEGYDVFTFKDNLRFLEVCLNRNGSSGVISPLYFDGACNFFKELPLPNDPKLEVYKKMALEAQNN
jgi:hypothetical protein